MDHNSRCRPGEKVVEKESTPDESSRENQVPEAPKCNSRSPELCQLRRSNEELWLLIDKQATCPLCLSEAHAVIDCPQLKVTTRRCSECGYTHSHKIGCRPADSILQRNKNPRRGQETAKVTPGSVPSRESEDSSVSLMEEKEPSNSSVSQLTRTNETEVRPEQPVPNAQVVENQSPVILTITRQAPTVPQPKGLLKMRNGPEQHVPNAQAVEGKTESLSPETFVEDKIPTTETDRDQALLFAPTWVKKNSTLRDQLDVRAPKKTDGRKKINKQSQVMPKDSQTEACGPLPVPLGDQNRSSRENDVPSALINANKKVKYCAVLRAG